MECASCHHKNPQGTRFCGQCGTPLVNIIPCQVCGASNGPGMRFCGQCGTALAPAVRPAAPPTTPSAGNGLAAPPPAPTPPAARSHIARIRKQVRNEPPTIPPPSAAPNGIANGSTAATPALPVFAFGRAQPDREVLTEERHTSAELAGVFPVAPPLNGYDPSLLPTMDERKLVTVLFGDISGFVQIAEKLDPEEVKRVMDLCLGRLAEEVERYEGRVDKFLGDNIMAIFGAPRAHEDDAERAVRCALEMQAAVRELSAEFTRTRGFALNLHIGLNTGEVLAGRMGAGRDQDYTVMGDVVNLAARLQHTAGPGEIVVGEATYRATAEVIDYRTRDAIQVRGKREPVNTWEVASVRSKRGSRRGIQGLEARMVGRDPQLTTLKTLFHKVANERNLHQVIVLGTAGIGKSRLLWEFEKYVDGLPQNMYFRKGRCLPFGPGVGFRALGEILKVQCGILDDDPRPVAETKLRESVQQVFAELVSTTGSLRDLVEQRASGHAQALAEAASTEDIAAIVHWLGVVLGLRRADDGTAIDPETVKEELFWALRRFYARLAASLPLVLAFEDVHWADSSLLDFIAHLRDSLAHLPILILCLARPEMAETGLGATWVIRSRESAACTILPLYPLTEPESRELIHELLPQANLPPEFEPLVLSKAEGNPLYLEELMRILIDSGVLVRRGGRWEVVRSLEGLRIPSSIQALVGARLDTLPEVEKRVIQGASVVGRIFWHGAVDEMFPQMRAAQVQAALDMLESREFIVKRSNLTFAGDTEYSFRNVLLRDVAYTSLPKALRGEAHAHVAAWIEGKAGDRLREFADLLAYHYEQALLLGREMLTLREDAAETLEDRTIHYLELAGDVASERHALAEAEQYYWRALEIMGASDRFPSDGGGGGPLHDRYLSVLCSHAGIVAVLEDYLRALAELNTAIEQARANPVQRARALLKRADVNWQLGNLDDVLRDATEALHLFRRLDDRRGKADARLLLGSVHRHRDNMEAAEGALNRALALFRAGDGAAPAAPRTSADLRGEARAMRELGIVALNRNDMAAAAGHMQAALDACRRLGDRWGVASCLRGLAQLHSYAPDLSRFEEYVQAALTLERDLGHTHGEATALVTLGFVRADRRRLDEAEQVTQQALAILLRLGDRRAAVWALRTLGMIAGLRGQPEAGRAHYEQALEMAQAGGIMGVLPEVYRGLAEVLLASGAVAAALDMAQAGTHAASPEDSYSQGSTWRALALAQHAAGRPAAALQSLEKSLRHLPAAVYPLERARSSAALAALTAHADPAAAATHQAAALLGTLVWADGTAPASADLLMLAHGPAGVVPG